MMHDDIDCEKRVSYNALLTAKSGKLFDLKLPLSNLLVNNIVRDGPVVDTSSSGLAPAPVEPNSGTKITQ